MAHVRGLAETRGRRQDEGPEFLRRQGPTGGIIQAHASTTGGILATDGNGGIFVNGQKHDPGDHETQAQAQDKKSQAAPANGRPDRAQVVVERPYRVPQTQPTGNQQGVISNLDMAAENLESQEKPRHADRAPTTTVENPQGPPDDPGHIHGRQEFGPVAVNTPGHDLGKQQPDHRAQDQVTQGQLPARQQPGHAQAAHQHMTQHPGQRNEVELVLQKIENDGGRVQELDVGQGPERRHACKKIRVPQGILPLGKKGITRAFEGVGVAGITALEHFGVKHGPGI